MQILITEFDQFLSQKYNTQRVEIQDVVRLTVTSVDQQAHLDFFGTGTVRVSGQNCSLKVELEKLLEGVRADPQFFQKALGHPAATAAITPEAAILAVIHRELYDFLPDHDRRALCAAFEVLLSLKDLSDFSPATMPVSRVSEGFLANVLVRVGVHANRHTRHWLQLS